MDDEIDIRRYIVLIVGAWKFYVILAVVFGTAAYLISRFVLSPQYEVKALVLITQSRYDLNFDPRFRTETNTQIDFYGPLNDLAVSDQMLNDLLVSLNEVDENSTYSVDILRGMLSVASGDVTNLIQLTVFGSEPEEVAKIANTWGELFVIRANQIYGEADDQTSLESQLVQLNVDLENAEDALIAFYGENDLLALQTEVFALENTYTQLFNAKGLLTETGLDISSFVQQLQTLPQTDVLSTEDQSTLLLLQFKAFNVYEEGIQLNIQNAAPTDRTVREAVEYLQALQTTLSLKSAEIDAQLVPFTERLLTIQSRIKVLETVGTRLQQTYDLSSENHLTLSRKIAESEISSQVSSGTIKLASRASVPANPVGPSVILNTLVGIILGGVAGIVWVLTVDFWRGANTEQEITTEKE